MENKILHIFMDSSLWGPALPIEIFCLKVVIVACSYVLAFQNPLCVCSYVCTGPELETPYKQATITVLDRILFQLEERLLKSQYIYEQATITALRQNTLLGRQGLQKRVFIMFSSLWECLSAFSLQNQLGLSKYGFAPSCTYTITEFWKSFSIKLPIIRQKNGCGF